jgi:hypothetical protein
MKYKIEDKKIYRGEEVIADIRNGIVDFREGMAKYRIHAMKEFNKQNEKPKPKKKEAVVEAKKDVTPRYSAAINTTPEGDWRYRLSLLLGETIPKPHPRTGYHGTKTGEILMKNRNKILNSDLLKKEEKVIISNLYC